VGAGVGVAAGGCGVTVGARVGVGGAGVGLLVGVAAMVINMGVKLFGVDVPVPASVAWATAPDAPPPDVQATKARTANGTIRIVKGFVFIVLPLF
jgi:hypothetical protein